MRACIVGATGVLGRALVPMLVKEGHSVLALARFTRMREDFFPSEVECHRFNLLSSDEATLLSSLLSGCDAVIHAATQIPTEPTTPDAWDVNTRLRTVGTRRLIDASIATGVRIYIQQSISMAYPDMGDQWIEESTQLDSSLERSGLCTPIITMESIVRSVDPQSMRWCILRGGLFVGKGTHQDVEIESLKTGRYVVPGAGRSFVSFVHVNDMASAVVAALACAPQAACFNINAEPKRLTHYADTLAETIGGPQPKRDPSHPDPPSFRCSNQAARRTLGWTPQHSIFPEQAANMRVGIPSP